MDHRARAGSALLGLVMLVGCGEDAAPVADPGPGPTSSSPPTASGSPTEARSARSAEARPRQTGTRVVARPSRFGTILFDDAGQAIYLFDVEKTTRPQCYGACAAAWPPVYAQGRPRAGGSVEPALLGTTTRRDGREQVTYGGHPLYYYAREAPGEVECHDVFLNGGYWYAVTPDGDRAP